MFEQTIETSANPRVTVAESRGNLDVRGSEEERVTLSVDGASDDVVVERDGESLTLSLLSDCTLTCPLDAALTIQSVSGNLRVTGVEGPVTVGTVHGNFDLRAVGPAAVEQTSGNLRVRQVMEDLHAEITRGNARIRGVEGALSLGKVHGNLAVEGARGGLDAGRVRGNARVGPPFSPGVTYRLSTNGNLTLRLPSDASLRLDVHARGGVRSLIPGLALEEEGDRARAVVGAGEASLEATVDGHLSLRPLEPEYGPVDRLDVLPGLEGLGAQIEARVAETMAEIEARLGESLGRIDGEEIRRRIERSANQFRHSEREAERARLRAERAERRWQRASGHRPRPRHPSATDEERMRVLRLVEEGKITPDQAADLLAALEGR